MKNRRQHGRQRRDERVVLQFVSSTHDGLPAGTVVRGSTKDVSPQGIRIQLDRRLPEGFLVKLCVEIPDHRATLFLAGEVKWCREIAEAKRSLVGVELTEQHTDDYKLWQEILEK